MTEVEQIIAALILDAADDTIDKKIKSTSSHLQDITIKRYGFEQDNEAYKIALDHLIETKYVTLHTYDGIEDYISVQSALAQNDGMSEFLQKNRLIGGSLTKDKTYEFPIIASYLDVGSSFIHDLASSYSSVEPINNKFIDSASWTGDYRVSLENQEKIIEIVRDIRAEIMKIDMNNADKANALAGISAIESLLDAEDPPWSIIINIFQSPLFANLTALAALAVSIIKV